MDEGATISTHVLDTEHGLPATNIAVELSRVTDDGLERAGGGLTDNDGRIRRLIDGPLLAGDYMISFLIQGPFFRELSISFRVTDTSRSYHVPLLLAPYSLASYRGS
jgi:5-hydroxyisourate hydrolase